jgi:hypothetical protein
MRLLRITLGVTLRKRTNTWDAQLPDVITTELRRGRYTYASLLALGLAGCATTITVTPKLVDTGAARCEIRAPLNYEGKLEYLPTVLVQDSVASGTATLRYRYDVNYDARPLNDVATLVNPLTLFGFPTGHDYTSVVSTLDLIQAGAVVRSYAAAAALKRTGTVFGEGESFTAMRRQGLLAVRDNISAQLCQDKAALVLLINAPAPVAGAESNP